MSRRYQATRGTHDDTTGVLDATLRAASHPTRYNRRRLAAARERHSQRVTAWIAAVSAGTETLAEVA